MRPIGNSKINRNGLRVHVTRRGNPIRLSFATGHDAGERVSEKIIGCQGRNSHMFGGFLYPRALADSPRPKQIHTEI